MKLSGPVVEIREAAVNILINTSLIPMVTRLMQYINTSESSLFDIIIGQILAHLITLAML